MMLVLICVVALLTGASIAGIAKLGYTYPIEQCLVLGLSMAALVSFALRVWLG
jgi:hypothetical protein